MSNVPFYPAAQPGGNYQYATNPQGMQTQTAYPQYVMMQNVQPGSQGQQPGYAIQQQYPFQHPGNHAYMQQGPGRTEQFNPIVLAAPFQPQAGQRQHSGLQQVHLYIML